MFDWTHPEVRNAIERALAEDIGVGDITSEFTVPADLQARGTYLAKQSFVLAGIELLPLIFDGRDVDLHLLKSSGEAVKAGDVQSICFSTPSRLRMPASGSDTSAAVLRRSFRVTSIFEI